MPTLFQRQCPTRGDGEVPLIVHQVTPPACQARQRASYHKCHTCVHQSGYVAAHPAAHSAREVEKPRARPEPVSQAV